jgi:LemA protein
MNGTVLAILVIVGVILLLGLGIVAWIISTRNSFARMNVKIDEAESGIDVALTKRYDTLTKMHQVVKNYVEHERKTLKEVIKMRNPKDCRTIAEKNEANATMDAAERSLNVVMEQYPQLKADALMVRLQDSVQEVEDNLAASRRIYNSNVSIFNQQLKSFPSSIIGRNAGYTEREFFKAEEGKKRDVDLKM